MQKKVISIVIVLCLIFSISVMAESENPAREGAAPEVSQQMPQVGEEHPQGDRGNMGMLPSGENPQVPGRNPQFGEQMPGGMGGFSGNMQSFNRQTQEEVPMTFSGFVKTYSTSVTSVILLGVAFVFVIFYRRKNY